MRIKSFMQFEWVRYEKPDSFVKLPSLGKYVDSRSGVFFDYDEEGRWDNQAGDWSSEEFDDLKDHLTKEEIEDLLVVWRSCEELVSPLVDWSIIDDIKQCTLAEEITDRGYQVRIQIRDGRKQFPNVLYSEWFDKGDVYWKRMFIDEYEELVESIPGLKDGLEYQVSVMMQNQYGAYMPFTEVGTLIDSPNSGGSVKYTMLQRKKHLMERIHSLHPGMEDKIVYVKW